MPVPFGSLRLPQPDFSATSFSTPLMRAALKPSPPALGRRACACVGQQVEPELHRILARRVRQLVDERLEHEREGVAARRAQRAGRHAERHHRIA